MESYTLNRFYFEAKALLEKYSINYENFALEVQFSIEEHSIYSPVNSAPTLKCGIYYRSTNSRIGVSEKGHWISECSPTHALSRFEEDIRKASGMFLKESVSVELPE